MGVVGRFLPHREQGPRTHTVVLTPGWTMAPCRGMIEPEITMGCHLLLFHSASFTVSTIATGS